MTEFPKQLVAVTGPFAAAKIAGAALGMGTHGDATRALVSQGLLQPDLITGMTLALLARQPRKPRPDGPKRASGVAGRVWVREQFTIHQPIARDDAWTVTGETTGTYVKKGRSYSTTASRSCTSDGDCFATNLTTGLFSYQPNPELADTVDWLALEDTPAPEPDWETASNNPHRDALLALSVGDRLGGTETLLSLEMMAARDTDNPDNPIHSNPEVARQAGLARPIAGGSHVLAFALEDVMGAVGPQALLHGAHFDIRWKAPTQDGEHIVSSATVTSAEPDRVVFDLQVELVDGPTAMVGTLTVPMVS